MTISAQVKELFSALSKDTSTCGQLVLGIKPSTLGFMDDCSTNHKCGCFTGQIVVESEQS